MSDAKQMNASAASDRGVLDMKSGGEYQQFTCTGPTGRSAKVPAGESPMKAMIDGPFGGKKPA